MPKINIIKNLFYKIQNLLIRLFRIRTLGVQAMVIDKNNVLLVYHTYVDNWYLIGGAIEPGEPAIEAVKRELFEEVGITPMEPPRLFGIYHNIISKPDDHVALYVVEEFIKEKSDSPEIEAIKWYRMDQLPANISPAAKRRIEEYLGRREITTHW